MFFKDLDIVVPRVVLFKKGKLLTNRLLAYMEFSSELANKAAIYKVVRRA